MLLLGSARDMRGSANLGPSKNRNPTHRPSTALAQPRHSPGTAQAQPRHSPGNGPSTAQAQSRHSQGTIQAHSPGTAHTRSRHSPATPRPQPRHGPSTARAQPRHSPGRSHGIITGVFLQLRVCAGDMRRVYIQDSEAFFPLEITGLRGGYAQCIYTLKPTSQQLATVLSKKDATPGFMQLTIYIYICIDICMYVCVADQTQLC